MWNLKPQYENKKVFTIKKGFTLVELMLSVGIMSLLIITFYTILSFNIKSNENNFLEDEILLNGRYIIEYIREEIVSADEIICSHHFSNLDTKFPTNVGFVIVKIADYEKSGSGDKDNKYKPKGYNYITYYFKNDSIIRIAGNTSGNMQILPNADVFEGYNKIGELLLQNSNITLQQNNIIKMHLSLGKDNKEIAKFNSNISIRCPLVR